jgi:hypothetical protein
MSFHSFSVLFGAIALLVAPLADGGLAQRSERGGGEGGVRSGGSGSVSSSRSGSGGTSFSRGSGGSQRNSSGRSSSQRSFSSGGSSPRSYSSDGRSISSDGYRSDASRQQSFYRGSEGRTDSLLQNRGSGSNRSNQFRQGEGFDGRVTTGSNSTFQSRNGATNRSSEFRDREASERIGLDSDRRDRNFDRDDRSDRARDGSLSRDNDPLWRTDSFREGDRDRDGRGRDRDDDRWSNGIRRGWGGHDRDDLPFRYGWWDDDKLSYFPVWSPWRYSWWHNRPYYWWGWSTPNVLTNWLVFGWDRPAYWSYGPGRNIYYQNEYVYYDGRQTMPAEDYYQYVYDLAHNIPRIDENQAESMEWKPLGVFAISRENESLSDRSLQLAVNQNGVISGTYYNRGRDNARPIAGRVDEQSQRAAWTFADSQDDHIIFETSLFNLTRPSTTMMVHFGPRADEAEVWRLTRLEQPEAATSASNAGRELP